MRQLPTDEVIDNMRNLNTHKSQPRHDLDQGEEWRFVILFGVLVAAVVFLGYVGVTGVVCG